MLTRAYSEALSDDPRIARGDERQALIRLTEMLDAASAAGAGSRVASEAVLAVLSVWSTMLEDLASVDNHLPADVRARLISIGIFVIKEADAIRAGRSQNFTALRDINMMIAEGLS